MSFLGRDLPPIVWTTPHGGRTITETKPDATGDANQAQTYRVQQTFLSPNDERLYGMAQCQDGVWNWRGMPIELRQLNTQAALPVLVSSRGYGLLWNNAALTDFNPIDLIVQDWQYWGSHGWGAYEWDASHYPDPEKLIQLLHQQNVRFMISVRSNPQGKAGADLKSHNYVIPGTDWVDALNPAARELRWRYLFPAPSCPDAVQDDDFRRFSRRAWARLIRKVYLADPLTCPKCGGHLRILGFIDNPCFIEKILRHLKLWEPHERPPPLQRSIMLEPDADFLDWAATARLFDAIDERSRSPRRTLSPIETGLHGNSAPRRPPNKGEEKSPLNSPKLGGASPLPFCLLGQKPLRNSWSHLPCGIIPSEFHSSRCYSASARKNQTTMITAPDETIEMHGTVECSMEPLR